MSGSDSSVMVSPSRSRNFASFSGWSGQMPSTSYPAACSGVDGVGEVAGLVGAAGRHRGRVEVHDDLAAQEAGQRHVLALVGREGEVGGRVAHGESA